MGAAPDEISTANPYRYIDGLRSRIFLRAISISAPICPDILYTVAAKKHEGKEYNREEGEREKSSQRRTNRGEQNARTTFFIPLCLLRPYDVNPAAYGYSFYFLVIIFNGKDLLRTKGSMRKNLAG